MEKATLQTMPHEPVNAPSTGFHDQSQLAGSTPCCALTFGGKIDSENVKASSFITFEAKRRRHAPTTHEEAHGRATGPMAGAAVAFFFFYSVSYFGQCKPTSGFPNLNYPWPASTACQWSYRNAEPLYVQRTCIQCKRAGAHEEKIESGLPRKKS
ncbi:hypothetical protein CRV24_006131 [Beauveria bassiana]|nr:hypothetical protein CRV24_006131 [Beauveria bassiana]